jgi:hypothetical protein
MVMRTLHPVRVHLDNLVNNLDWEATLALRSTDFFSISALAVDKLQHVKCHFNLRGVVGAEGMREGCRVVKG